MLAYNMFCLPVLGFCAQLLPMPESIHKPLGKFSAMFSGGPYRWFSCRPSQAFQLGLKSPMLDHRAYLLATGLKFFHNRCWDFSEALSGLKQAIDESGGLPVALWDSLAFQSFSGRALSMTRQFSQLVLPWADQVSALVNVKAKAVQKVLYLAIQDAWKVDVDALVRSRAQRWLDTGLPGDLVPGLLGTARGLPSKAPPRLRSIFVRLLFNG